MEIIPELIKEILVHVNDIVENNADRKFSCDKYSESVVRAHRNLLTNENFVESSDLSTEESGQDFEPFDFKHLGKDLHGCLIFEPFNFKQPGNEINNLLINDSINAAIVSNFNRSEMKTLLNLYFIAKRIRDKYS